MNEAASIEIESLYDIIENSDKDLLFILKVKQGSPERPTILYAGEEHALLYRNTAQTVVLDFIHVGVRKSLRQKKEALVVELRGSSIIREYMVSVRQVSKLPIPEDKLPKEKRTAN